MNLYLAGILIDIHVCLLLLPLFAPVFHLGKRWKALELLSNRDSGLSVTDYAVRVRNLPPDTTEEELLAHFSALYQLSVMDWRKRGGVIDTRPVEKCEVDLFHRALLHFSILCIRLFLTKNLVEYWHLDACGELGSRVRSAQKRREIDKAVSQPAAPHGKALPAQSAIENVDIFPGK